MIPLKLKSNLELNHMHIPHFFFFFFSDGCYIFLKIDAGKRGGRKTGFPRNKDQELEKRGFFQENVKSYNKNEGTRRIQSLWGEGRSPSFIFFDYPNTVARVQQAPGQVTIHNWGDMRSAMCAPKGQASHCDRKCPGKPTSLSDSTRVTRKCGGSLCEAGKGF